MKLLPLLLFALLPISSFAQNLQRDVRLIQNTFQDGSLVGTLYGEAGLSYNDFDFFNVLEVGGQIGFPIGNKFELGVDLHYLTVDPNAGSNTSGLTDIGVTGRALVSDGPTNFSVGGMITLPTGDEEIGQGDVDIGIFGAVRHPASDDLAITGVLGIDFIERGDERDASLHLGGGVIYRIQRELSLIGELDFLTELDYALLSAGIDYIVGSSARLRPAIGLGLDDGAPDFALIVGILFL